MYWFTYYKTFISDFFHFNLLFEMSVIYKKFFILLKSK